MPRATGATPEDKPAVYPFLPAPDKNTGAAILVCPGGGNQTRCVDFEGILVAQWLKEHGIAAFVLRYRIAPLYTSAEARLDTQRGVQYLRAHAAELKIDPARIGVMGGSAGGHLCGLLAMTSGRDEARFVDASLDRGTLDEVGEVLDVLSALSPEAAFARQHVSKLAGTCDRAGNLPASQRHQLGALVGMLESSLQ